jgi:hypothetical protein
MAGAASRQTHSPCAQKAGEGGKLKRFITVIIIIAILLAINIFKR